jgi:phage terminase large subunit GpA-like protein
MRKIDNIGSDWIVDSVEDLTDHVEHITPSQYNEENRYLPESVTSIPGFIRYAVNPFMREIVDCFDINSPVRELNLKKGVQITYSTVIESGALYFMGHIKTLPIMYLTADKELAAARIENNFIPMLNHSDLGHIIRSSDDGNTRKTGKTANHLQFEGGGYLVPFGANNSAKMRSFSICVLLKDEIDGWPDTVGSKKEDPDKTSDGRCKGYWERRKIFRGSTPLIEGTSKIQKAYLKGDQRKYMVNCLNKECGHSQFLKWENIDKETGVIGGFQWDLDEDGILVLESVRYCCHKCGHPHYEHDKERLFSEDHGAYWKPTAKPTEAGIRSYHLPAMYSPIGMAPWYSLVADYLSCYDPVRRVVTDIGEYQAFYNNVLAEPFKVRGSRVGFASVSAHRRAVYRLGEIPNKYAAKYSGSNILFLTCQVDVHKKNLAVSVKGWTRDAKPYVIDYWRFEVDDDSDDCRSITCPVWGKLRELIEEKEYTADDGKKYRVAITLVDAGYANDTVTTFCSDYASGVYPILGRDRPAKNQTIKEFAEFTTQAGTIGYRILVDHYKDRMAPVLRREWSEESGDQKKYHFNAPVDITDKQLKELTVETRREKTDDKGATSYDWHRPSGAPNELWDLLGYGYAAVEILAWAICIQHFKLETIDWPRFWDYVEGEKLYYQD